MNIIADKNNHINTGAFIIMKKYWIFKQKSSIIYVSFGKA
jgi:hypothetical protein